MTRDEIFAAITKERERQDRLHPNFCRLSLGDRLAVLGEEFGEVCSEVQFWGRGMNEIPIQGMGPLKDELVQVAAVAIRWLEAMT